MPFLDARAIRKVTSYSQIWLLLQLSDAKTYIVLSLGKVVCSRTSILGVYHAWSPLRFSSQNLYIEFTAYITEGFEEIKVKNLNCFEH